MKVIFVLIFLLQILFCFSQEIRPVEASYSMVLSRTSSIVQTELNCIEQARIKAIGEEFGYLIAETTISNLTDSNGKVNDQFSVLTNTSVKGEWIKDTAPPEIVWECLGGQYQVTVKVHGEVRSIKIEGRATLNFFSCSPNDLTHPKYIFKNDDLLNCSLASSHNGFVSIFYLDHTSQEALRILPSSSFNYLDGLEIKADKTYILFNKDFPYQFQEMKNSPANLILGIAEEKDQVIDEIIVIFSPTKFSKPRLSNENSPNTLPKFKISEFEKWKNELISRNPEVVIAKITITIVK